MADLTTQSHYDYQQSSGHTSGYTVEQAADGTVSAWEFSDNRRYPLDVQPTLSGIMLSPAPGRAALLDRIFHTPPPLEPWQVALTPFSGNQFYAGGRP